MQFIRTFFGKTYDLLNNKHYMWANMMAFFVHIAITLATKVYTDFFNRQKNNTNAVEQYFIKPYNCIQLWQISALLFHEPSVIS